MSDIPLPGWTITTRPNPHGSGWLAVATRDGISNAIHVHAHTEEAARALVSDTVRRFIAFSEAAS